jgi:predicted ATPase
MGDPTSAREHLENAITQYDPERHRILALRFEGYDAKLINLILSSWALWTLGYPDQALQRSKEALAFAERLSNPRDLTRVFLFAAMIHLSRRDPRATEESSEAVFALSAEHGITEWLPWATLLRGSAIAAQGQHKEGIAQIEEGMAMSRATGLELFKPYWLCVLADACIEAGRLNEGLNALTEALATADQGGERQSEAEIHRLKGKLLLRQDESNAGEARKCFERAIEVARQQSARSWELRATMSLARLLMTQGKRDEARAMLADIYNWFTEGFDTADLKDAKSLLAELNA